LGRTPDRGGDASGSGGQRTAAGSGPIGLPGGVPPPQRPGLAEGGGEAGEGGGAENGGRGLEARGAEELGRGERREDVRLRHPHFPQHRLWGGRGRTRTQPRTTHYARPPLPADRCRRFSVDTIEREVGGERGEGGPRCWGSPSRSRAGRRRTASPSASAAPSRPSGPAHGPGPSPPPPPPTPWPGVHVRSGGRNIELRWHARVCAQWEIEWEGIERSESGVE